MTDTLNFTDEEFLQVVNMICKKEINLGTKYVPITDMSESIALNRLDSLGIIIFFVWIAELFEIPEDRFNDLTEQGEFTVRELQQFVETHHTRVLSYEDVQAYVER